MFEFRFKIGDIVIALISDQLNGSIQPPIALMNQGLFSVEESYQKFITPETPDAVLHHHYGKLPELAGWQNVFETGGVWRLFKSGDQFAIVLSSPVFGPEPYRMAIFSSDFLSGEIFTSSSYFSPENIPFPLSYPLAEVLMINLLGHGRGILLHACAVKDSERGLLFSGVSGAGKSTTAYIWENQAGTVLLSDDRVILRPEKDGFWIYGTPWHGDARASAQEAARLEKIFVLRHSPQNQVIALKPIELAARLFVRSFPPFWNPQGVDFSLNLLSQVSQSVAGYELRFVPDAGVIQTVRSIP